MFLRQEGAWKPVAQPGKNMYDVPRVWSPFSSAPWRMPFTKQWHLARWGIQNLFVRPVSHSERNLRMRLVQNEGVCRDFKTCNDTPGATKHHGHNVACRSCSILMIWEFLRYALRLHLFFSLFGDKSNTSMDMSGSGRILPLPNVLMHLLSYNLVAAAGTERWLTWEKQESGAGMIWPSNLAPKIQSSYPLVRSNSSVVERLGEK